MFAKCLRSSSYSKSLNRPPPNPQPSALQVGFQENLSCIHSALILQEAIQFLHDKGKKAYVAYLNVNKSIWARGTINLSKFTKGA